MAGDSERQRFATKCIHAGNAPDPTTGAITPAIYQTSTYVQASPGVFKEDFDYSRSSNPTRKVLERKLAAIEGGAVGLSFSSGVSTIDACLHLLSSGDHVVLCDDVYGGTFRVFKLVFERLGIDITRVDMTDLDATRGAFRDNTKMVWLETPTNPTLKIVDIAAVTAMAREHGAFSVVDNTFATPALQSPLSLGADVVSHSVTKYLNGHTDVVGGALIAKDEEFGERLRYIQNAVGAVPAPMDCFLVHRSIQTLHLRMERHCANAKRIATHLESHPKIASVRYPGLESHPQHQLAKLQMRDFGGMITATLHGDEGTARKFLEEIELFALAESLGGVESLIEHPGIMTHATIPREEREALGIGDTLVRFSVGIEDCDDLLEDIDRALAAC